MLPRIATLLLLAPALQGHQATDLETFRQQAECRQCHVAVGKEWGNSRHALAGRLNLERYLLGMPQGLAARLAAYYRPSILLGSGLGSAPRARRQEVEAGVDCLACHMDPQYRMHGPLALTAPHRVVEDAAYSGTRLCASCHGRGDELDQFRSWKAAGYQEAELTCQSCHMPQISRRLVQHWAMPELPRRLAHNHAFRGVGDGRFLKTAFRLSLARQGDEVEVRLASGVIGHSFPGIAFRQLVVESRGFLGEKVLWRRRELIDGIVHRNRIEPSHSLTYHYPIAGARRLQTRLLYKWTPATPRERSLLLGQETLEWKSPD